MSRATIVQILRRCSRLEDVLVNPAVFIDQLTEAINAALYRELIKGIVYRPNGTSWSADLLRDRFQDESVASRIVPVTKSITDHVICDSEVQQRFAEFLEAAEEVPLFLKLPDWFKVARGPDGEHAYLVRETKGGHDIQKLRWEPEGWKIRFEERHFEAIKVDYAFGENPKLLIDSDYRPSTSYSA